jgi:hypothetical protein
MLRRMARKTTAPGEIAAEYSGETS